VNTYFEVVLHRLSSMAVAYVRNISYSRKLLIHLVLVEILFDLLLLLMCCEENGLWYRSLFGIRNNEIMKTHADRFLPHVYTQLPKYYGYLKTVSHVVGAIEGRAWCKR